MLGIIQFQFDRPIEIVLQCRLENIVILKQTDAIDADDKVEERL